MRSNKLDVLTFLLIRQKLPKIQVLSFFFLFARVSEKWAHFAVRVERVSCLFLLSYQITFGDDYRRLQGRAIFRSWMTF